MKFAKVGSVGLLHIVSYEPSLCTGDPQERRLWCQLSRLSIAIYSMTLWRRSKKASFYSLPFFLNAVLLLCDFTSVFLYATKLEEQLSKFHLIFLPPQLSPVVNFYMTSNHFL